LEDTKLSLSRRRFRN